MKLDALIALAAGSLLTAGTAHAENPYEKPNDSWISISGTAQNTKDASFMLDYGKGIITVEMDDWDAYGEAKGLIDGDKVTVYGKIDDDLYEVAKIEAAAVYVDDLNTYFYANADDEEDVFYWTPTNPIVIGGTNLRGTVTSVSEMEKEFTVDTGIQKVTVESEFLGYNPVDDLGYQKIEKGDTVSVTGVMDTDFLEGRVLEADSVITLSDGQAKGKKSKKKKK